MDNLCKALVSTTLVIGLICGFCQGHNSYAMTYELDDNDKMCFHEKFKDGQKYLLEFQVLKGGKLDVDVSLESPNGKIIYKEQKRTKEQILFDTSYGEWTFCFSNEFSTITHKTIYFELRPQDHKTLKDEVEYC